MPPSLTIMKDSVDIDFCSRTPWQGDEESLKRIAKSSQVNAEGYVNVASMVGLSGVRGMIRLYYKVLSISTYESHRYFVV